NKIKEMEKEKKELEKKGKKTDKKRINTLHTLVGELKEQGQRKVVYVESENTLDEEWARLNGLDTASLILARPQEETAEEVIQIMLDLIDSGEVELMILDSLPMLVSHNIYY